MRHVAFAARAVGAALVLAGAAMLGVAWLFAPEPATRTTHAGR